MSNLPDTLRYAKSHEWLRLENDGTAVIGITDYAQDSLGDITYVQLPVEGEELTAGGPLGVVESVKAASDIYAPVSGEVIAANEAIVDAPETINNDPYEGGWFFKLKPANASELDNLLDAAGYQAACDE